MIVSRATSGERLFTPNHCRKPFENRGDKRLYLSTGARKNPTVAFFRYRGVEVAGARSLPLHAMREAFWQKFRPAA